MPSLSDRLPELASRHAGRGRSRDAKFRAIAEQMADALPAARLVVAEGAGHAVPLEAPEVVAAAIVG